MAKPARLSAKQLRLLARLSSLPSLRNFSLCGGTAVGWHFGHRRSIDLDLFSNTSDAALEPVVSALTQAGAQVLTESDVMVGLDMDGVRIDVVRYGYAPLARPRPGPGEFLTAMPLDLAVMKLAAIARRGLRRDFWDLHVIATGAPLPLTTVFTAYCKRYQRVAADEYHVLRALTWFEDAERDDPRVIGLSARRWADIRGWFVEQASRLALKSTR